MSNHIQYQGWRIEWKEDMGIRYTLIYEKDPALFHRFLGQDIKVFISGSLEEGLEACKDAIAEIFRILPQTIENTIDESINQYELRRIESEAKKNEAPPQWM
jgi:hypothetical protein